MSQPLAADLLGYLLGALEPEEHRKVDRALTESPLLHDELINMRRQLVPLARVEETDPIENVPAGMARRVCEFVARESRAQTARSNQIEGDSSEASGNDKPASKKDSVSDTLPVADTSPVTGKAPVTGKVIAGPGLHDDHNGDEDHQLRPQTQRIVKEIFAAIDARQVDSAGSSKAVTASGFGGRSMSAVGGMEYSDCSIWSLADYVVATAVAMLVMGLITPALLASRNQSRLTACQDNLRRIGTGLFNYAESHSDRFVPINKDGALNVAGAYAPVLKDAGFISASNVFYCSSAIADGLQEVREIPTLADLESAARENGTRLDELQSMMGGSYGYTLGYYDHDRYIGPVNMGRSFRVIMADTPSDWLENRASGNHGGLGQNLLFEDGSIRFAQKSSIGFPRVDSIFENHSGVVAAGIDVNDSVIGASNATAWIPAKFFSTAN